MQAMTVTSDQRASLRESAMGGLISSSAGVYDHKIILALLNDLDAQDDLLLEAAEVFTSVVRMANKRNLVFERARNLLERLVEPEP
jgi:hypothetical protein